MTGRGDTRRAFLTRLGVGAAVTGAVLGGLATFKNGAPSEPLARAARRGLLRPPGAVEEDGFLARCIRCQRCAEACAVGAIALLPPGHGRLEGTPTILPERTACNLCLACGKACPTGALLPLEEKKEARMGTAVVFKDLCVSHNGTGICGACFTMCPLRGKAIVQGAHNAPTVDPRHCVGCGLCEEACIVDGDKAIRALSPRLWS